VSIHYNAPAIDAIRECRIISVADVLESDYAEGPKERARLGNYRSLLCVPMQAGDRAVGSIVVTRREPGQFPERHVALLQTFADQAVIAIENVRLFKELEARTGALELAFRRADEANRAKTSFLAAASHDLRQPIHAMALFVSALKSKSEDPKTRSIVDHLVASVESLEGLFDALLDISKLDAGIVRAEIGDFPLQPIFERVVQDCASDASEKGLRLVVVPTRAIVRSDATLIERIVRNLVSNAIRYTKAGGLVLGCRRAGGNVRIAVCDTGIGIEPTQLPQIFKEFFQVANVERDRAKGLGLGLAIVERLARLLGHAVTVASVPGRGSTFSVTLPRGESPSLATAPAPAEAAPEGSLGGALVVVIDDEAAVREGMREVLSQWDCRPMLAGSAEDALAQLAAYGSPPRAVIADYRLRDEKTGSDAIERIRAGYGASIPGVIITGDTAPDRLREAQASGYHLMHKPVSPVKLRALLSYLLA
jgi:signal transduction histidine kinase